MQMIFGSIEQASYKHHKKTSKQAYKWQVYYPVLGSI